ncbi:MAG: sodium ion-translocating decarboxylase subunit beta [Oscillospiraceae bacterium]|nr:sodium ion-translocating decarboxylase subunit beta [Oscillospiraceae bacterium]
MTAILNFLEQTGFYQFAQDGNWKCLIMMGISFVLMYLAIVKKFEPLLLLPIAFGMLMTNLPGAEMFHEILFAGGHVHWDLFGGAPITAEFVNGLEGITDTLRASFTSLIGTSVTPGLVDYLYLGVKLGIYPCLIFLGVGCMTDFGPLIANPKSLLLGAAAQLGIFMTYAGCRLSGMFTAAQASSIGIIGGADGPTAIFVTTRLAPELLGPIAVAAYSYMALVPVIQPPIMKLLTTKAERQIIMKPLRQVSRKEKILFPIVTTVFVSLLVPSAAPLVACLMLGVLFKETGVVDRLSKAAQNELMNIVTIFLGISVGCTATANTFLSPKTLVILAMGIVAFAFGTAGGVLLAKVMNLFLKDKINPLIGSAGVSAVPMAARVSQTVGQKENPGNFLLMHAMGPNVAGVIGSAIAAGVLMALFG